MGKQAVLKIFGIIFILGAIYIAACGISNYQKQLDQKDWRVVTATVTYVKQYKKSTGLRKNRSKTVYDIIYEYNFNSDCYMGEISGTVTRKNIGDTFDVKCDPTAPECSTHILQPLPDALVANIFGACMFGLVGLWTFGFEEIRLKKTANEMPTNHL